METKILKNIDWKLIGIVMLIFIIGLVTISSATHMTQGGSPKQLIVQIASFFIGAVAVAFITMVDYNKLGKYHKEIYVINILLLLMVYIPGLGVKIAGARSWIDLKVINLQTSELVKIGFILSFGKYIEKKKDQLNTIRDLIPVLIYCAPILLLILKQPDLGTAIVFMSIILGMLFVSGLGYNIIRNAIISGVIALPVIYKLLKDHQKTRIDAFLHPGDPRFEGNYQVIQSLIAIGSGKIFGKGLYNGTQNKYNFLPVQETDFIYAVLGEEMGLIGAGLLLFLFGFFVMRMLKIANYAKDFYGTLISIGVIFMFLYQIVQNIGMTIAVMPVTGVTLPFVSYGGSSLLTSMMALGLVLNVSMRRRQINF